MPHTEIKYTSDVTLDTQKMFSTIATIIAQHDKSAGVCKGRAYSTDEFLHSHILVDIKVLKKAHRDEVFMENLLQALKAGLTQDITAKCSLAIFIGFIPAAHLIIDL